ncbi:hypothetical protein [Kitasatospora sp. NPDC088548]|uniref:hypothetical protein n=1 Tax=Kitasatospora sp. NPDC088548 TaxID=3364075 RepID=UPI00381081B4
MKSSANAPQPARPPLRRTAGDIQRRRHLHDAAAGLLGWTLPVTGPAVERRAQQR